MLSLLARIIYIFCLFACLLACLAGLFFCFGSFFVSRYLDVDFLMHAIATHTETERDATNLEEREHLEASSLPPVLLRTASEGGGRGNQLLWEIKKSSTFSSLSTFSIILLFPTWFVIKCMLLCTYQRGLIRSNACAHKLVASWDRLAGSLARSIQFLPNSKRVYDAFYLCALFAARAVSL